MNEERFSGFLNVRDGRGHHHPVFCPTGWWSSTDGQTLNERNVCLLRRRCQVRKLPRIGRINKMSSKSLHVNRNNRSSLGSILGLTLLLRD